MSARPRPDDLARHAYFLGTNFSGSTVLGQALGAHRDVTYLGEVDRLVHFPLTFFPDEPEATCHHCELAGQPCSVWTPDRVAVARRTRYGDLMAYFQAELGSPVLVDGSKHPNWLRYTLAEQPAEVERTVAFVTVRSPFGFCDSYRSRTGCQMWEAANIWRDVYYDAVRMLNQAGLPSMVVRYERFALEPEPVLRHACALLGIDYAPEMRYFRSQPSHDLGGNHGVYAVARDESGAVSGIRARGVAATPSAGSAEPAGSREQAEAQGITPFGGWVDEKWQRRLTAGEVEQVLQTPGLTDVANLLGYELTREVAAWERRQPAGG